MFPQHSGPNLEGLRAVLLIRPSKDPGRFEVQDSLGKVWAQGQKVTPRGYKNLAQRLAPCLLIESAKDLPEAAWCGTAESETS